MSWKRVLSQVVKLWLLLDGDLAGHATDQIVSKTFKSESDLKDHQIILSFPDEKKEAQKGCGKTLKGFNQAWANRALLLNSLSKSVGDTKQRNRETPIGWDNGPKQASCGSLIIIINATFSYRNSKALE